VSIVGVPAAQVELLQKDWRFYDTEVRTHAADHCGFGAGIVWQRKKILVSSDKKPCSTRQSEVEVRRILRVARERDLMGYGLD
jgi:hypothetical protein